MDKPFIFCHMEISPDGKIMGKYLWLPSTSEAPDSFSTLVNGPDAKYHYQAMLNGRTTIDDNFTFYAKPELDENAPQIPAGDYLAEGVSLGQFLLAVDGHGKLAWQENFNEYDGVKSHIVEILTEAASNSYKAFLRKKGISYLICGKDSVDLPLLCAKIKNVLHVDSVMLGGGAVLNWSMVQAGLVDELSLVMAPAADGSTETQTLFMAKPGITTDQPVLFKPLEVKIMPDDAIWIRYQVGKKVDFDFESDPEFKETMEMIRSHR